MDPVAAQNIVNVLAAVLQKLIDANDSRPAETTTVTKFHALRSPSITVQAYLERILKYANCSGECFVLALVYIDRLIQRNNFVINSLNVHRIIITSVMLAAKFFDDHYYNNTYYAKIGGVPRSEINQLELEFLFLINFTLYLKPEEYKKYYDELCNETARDGLLPDHDWYREEVDEESSIATENEIVARSTDPNTSKTPKPARGLAVSYRSDFRGSKTAEMDVETVDTPTSTSAPSQLMIIDKTTAT